MARVACANVGSLNTGAVRRNIYEVLSNISNSKGIFDIFCVQECSISDQGISSIFCNLFQAILREVTRILALFAYSHLQTYYTVSRTILQNS